MSTRGDFLDLVQIGGSSKFNFSGQQFFVDANYGVTRYFQDTAFDSTQYSLDAGVNWTLTSRCTGTLRVSKSVQPSVFEETVGVGVNIGTTEALTEIAKCGLGGDFSLLVNSSYTQTSSSVSLDQLNAGVNQNLSVGLSYDGADLDSLQALYTITDIQYPFRAAVSNALGISPSTLGLAEGVLEKDVTATYQRAISPLLNATLTAGLTDMTLEALGPGGSTSTLAPHYAISLTWQATPKAQLGARISRSVGPPTSLVANTETTTSAQLTGGFTFSPKLSFSSALTIGQSNGGGETFLVGTQVPISSNQNFVSANLGLAYQASPFLSATASYQYSDRKTAGFDTAEGLFIIGLRYAPY
jgi:Putative beta-barrel porin 2